MSLKKIGSIWKNKFNINFELFKKKMTKIKTILKQNALQNNKIPESNKITKYLNR